MDTNFQTIDNSTFTDPILQEVESVLYFIVQNYKSFIQDSTNTHEKISEFDKELGDVLERYKQLYNITSNITEEELQKIAIEFRTEIENLSKKVTVDYKGLIDAQLQLVDNLIIDINNKVTNDYFKGDKGEPFLYSDFTPEQIESLKVKGDKGDPFKYTDFTPSQLDSLMDIHSKTAKTTPVDADEITLADSTSSFSLKKITWATIKSLFANRLPTSTLNALVKFGDTLGTLKNGVGAYLTDTGNMLIGTTVDNGVDKLQVDGNISNTGNVNSGGGQFNIFSSSSIYEIVNRASVAKTFQWYIGPNGSLPIASLTTSGVWTNASDKRNKTNIKDIPYGLSTVMLLSPKEYDLKSDGTHAIGFIAQDVKEIIPELVFEAKEGSFLTLDYASMVSVLVKAIQEQQIQINQLKGK